MKERNSRVVCNMLFVFTFLLLTNFAIAQDAGTVTTPSTDLQSIFGNLNLDEAKQAEENFEQKAKTPITEVPVPLLDTHEDKKVVKLFDKRDNTLLTSSAMEKDNDKENSKGFFKFKKGKGANIDQNKLKSKIEKARGGKRSLSIQASIDSLKLKQKSRRTEKDLNKVQADIKTDFDSLKKLNDQIQLDTDSAVKSTLSKDEQEAVEKVEGNILFQSDDYYTPNDINLTINSVKDWAQSAILSDYPSLYSTVPTLNRPVVVAVVDAGVDYTHEELSGRMWSATNCVDENNQNIAGGCTNGYDFVDNDKDPSPTDGFDHGTAVASLIAGSTDNSKGIAALSQNRAKIMALRVSDNGLSTLDNLTRAIYFAVNNGADVINMSLSGPTYSQSLFDALTYAKDRGIVVVVSAGNQGLDLETTKVYPASYDISNIYVVGSLDTTGSISAFSNYGIKTVDVLAPGREVLTATLANNYSLHSGTSFSAPIFASLVSRWVSEGKDVKEEWYKLKSNSTFAQRVIQGKTLAFSYSTADLPTPVQTLRYILLPGGNAYLDVLSKAGTIVDASSVNTLDYATQNTIYDTGTGIATPLSPGDYNYSNPGTVFSTTQTFTWASTAGAKYYGFYLSDVTGLTSSTQQGVKLVTNDNVGATSYTYSGLVSGHTYVWNTGAGSKTIQSAYNLSQARMFKVSGGGSAPTSAPTPSSPVSATSPGSYFTGSSITVSWSGVSGATSYVVNSKSLAGGQYGEQTITGTSFTFPLSSNNTYYWYVRACNSYGCSPNSANNYYNTNAPTPVNLPPSVPAISGPTSANTGTATTYNFVSTDPEGSAITYDIIWDNDFSGNVSTVGSYSSGTLAPQTKTFSTAKTQCIRARAKDTSNNYSQYSNCYNVNITTINKPDLVISTMSPPLSSVAPGASINLPLTIVNQGTLATSNGFRVGVYIGNILVGSYTRATALTAGASDAQTIAITIPTTSTYSYTGSGQYGYVVRVDDLNQVSESNENNDLAGNFNINLPVTGKSFIPSVIATQVAGQLFTVSFTQTGYTGATLSITADGNQISQTTFSIQSSASQQIQFKLLKANSNQALKFVINGSDVIYSNTFTVLPDTSIIPTTVPNAGSITVTVRDFGNQVVSGATVDVCGFMCDNTKVTKTTDSSGKVTFTSADIGNLKVALITATKGSFASRTRKISYNLSAPNSYDIQTVTTVNDVFHNPVILIPGLGGSTLSSDNLAIPVLGTELPPASSLKIADVDGDSTNVAGLGWENLRKNFETLGYVRGQTLFDCPYDWRSSNDVTMNVYFKKCVDDAIQISGKNKVDVVAHSMGGLVTRAYIQTSKANADKIGKIAFLGTPEMGASMAYKIWEGGDTAWDPVRTAIIARTIQAMYGPAYNYENYLQFTGISPTFMKGAEFATLVNIVNLDQNLTKKFVQNHAFSIRQLIPTYTFLYKKVNGANVPVVVNETNQNEFLLALNGQSCIGICDDGSNSGQPYVYRSFSDSLVQSGLTAKIFYSDAKVTDNGYIVTPSAPTSSLYPDGIVTDDKELVGLGDGTVPIQSTIGFANTIPGMASQVLNGEHSKLPSVFSKQTAEWISGQTLPNLASLQAVTVTSHFNLTLGSGVTAYLTDPNGKTLGINTSGVAENTIGSDAKATVDASGVTFAIDNPTTGKYTLNIDGPDKGNYDFYSEFSDSNHRDVVSGKRFHQGTRETITFTITGTTDAASAGMKYDKIETVPQNIVVSNNAGNTKISWALSSDATVAKYRVYSKAPLENNFTQIAEVTGNIYNTTDIFAGTLETFTRDYRVSTVFSDGSESNLSLDYFNNDTDWDGLTDAQEAINGTTPTKVDTDNDGLPDGVETNITLTNPTLPDTDNNGVDDYNDNKVKFSLKDKIIATTTSTTTIFFEDFNRANSSTIGGLFTDGADTNDNLKIANNRLNMKWVSQVWGNFHNLQAPLAKQNNIKITYKWNLVAAPGIDGYLPFIGVRGGGSATNDLNGSYGAALYYMGQTDSVYVHVLDRGALKVNTLVLSAPLKNTDYNVEIKINTQNFLEFRIWKVGDAYPTNPQASWNNGGNTYTNVSNGNNLILTAFHGSGAQYNVDVSIDDLRVDDMTVPNSLPVVTINGSSTVSVYRGGTYTDLGATAIDAEDGDLTSKIIKSGTVDTSKLGTTTITYTVSDTKFATTTVTRLVNIVSDPGPLSLLSYYKFDGPVSTTTKFIDEMRIDGLLTASSSGLASEANLYGYVDRAFKTVTGATGGLFANSPALLKAQAMTYSLWFKSDDVSGYSPLIEFPTTDPSEYVRIALDHGQATAILSTVSGGAMSISATSTATVTNSTWHKLDAVYTNSPNTTVKLFIDGRLSNSSVGTRPYSLTATSTNKMTIGYGANKWMASTSIDELRVFGRELTESEILSEYQKEQTASTSTIPTNTVLPDASYMFNGALGSASKKLETIKNISGVILESNVTADIGRDGNTSGAYTMNGTGNVVFNNPYPLATTSQTISVWFKSSVVASKNFLSLTSGNQYVNLWLYNGGLLGEINSTSGYTGGGSPHKAITDGKWHKVDLVIKNGNSSQILTIYVDGVADSGIGGVTGFNFSPTITTISLGANYNTGMSRYENFGYGTYDDFKVYNKDLTAQQIADNYTYDKLFGLSGYTLQGVEEETPVITTVETDISTLPEFLQKIIKGVQDVLQTATDTIVNTIPDQQTTENVPVQDSTSSEIEQAIPAQTDIPQSSN